MAAAAQPSGLMDIASSLTQDEIPFKLRCAICNKLAVNAFRLPCCDQAICENCQASLPDTCPVCAHTPISSELCKPNKALRTTLKAFLRTEEKKRERERQERQAAQPATSDVSAPAEETLVEQDPQQDSDAVEEAPADGPLLNTAEDSSTGKLVGTAPSAAEVDIPGEEQDGTNGVSQDEQPETAAPDAADPTLDAEQKNAEGENAENIESIEQPEQAAQNTMSGSGFPYPMGINMNPGMFPNMAWSTNPMAQFMGGGIMGFPNPMGMAAMGMDPMAASQGMFGGYGMNMNGMSNGMNMGMNFNAGQGMYGGWDGSQNNMWNGSQDKFNPNAFANGMGAQFGDPSGFGGYNMSQQPNGVHPQMQQQQFPNQEFQNGYHGPGNYRGRGRGYYFNGRGRGGYSGHMQPNFPLNANSAALQDNTSSADQIVPSQTEEGAADATATQDNIPLEGKKAEDGSNTAGASFRDQVLNDVEANGGNGEPVPGADGHADQAVNAEHQLQGIPTVDSLNQPYNVGVIAAPTHTHQGFGRGGSYMRGGFHGRGNSFGGQQQFMPAPNMQPRGPGVEGAPAAPRAMRQGLPNTSVFRQRNFQLAGRGSIAPSRGPEASVTPHTEPTLEDQRPQSTSRSISRARSRSRSGSRSRSKPRSRSRSRSRVLSRSNSRRRYRPRSRSVEDDAVDYDRQRERRRRPHPDEKDRTADDERRTRSPSIESHRSLLRDRERDRRRSHRSRRSHRRRSRSRSASGDRNGDSWDNDRLPSIAEERSGSKPRSRDADTPDTRRSGKDRLSRREEDRERDRDARRRERDRERDRDRDRDRDRHREKERERDRERDRDRPRERDRDRKRSRRDRSESAADSDYHPRKAKRGRDDDTRTSTSNRDRPKDTREKTLSSNQSEPEKDPHTLEREARNHERLLKEQQRREAMQADRDAGRSGRRRDSRQERSGRRLNYKYDDETDAARAARVEREREAARWE